MSFVSIEALSEVLCRHVAETRFEDLSPEAIVGAKRVLLDATGVMYGASGLSEEVQAFVRVACSEGDGACVVLGTGRTATASMAALANGAMAHALDYEDAFDAAPGHPNASMVPALLALAQCGAPVAGKDMIAALAVGCDLSCRLALGLTTPLQSRGWYPPPILGAYAAAAGGARLLGLGWEGVRDAVSLMLCQATMPGAIMHSSETVVRAVREAFPAQAGVLAAKLAAEGVRGFDAPFEGRDGFYDLFAGGGFDADRVIAELGERWYGAELSFKPWPACRGTHAFVELAIELREAHGFAADDVAGVEVLIDPIHRMLVEPIERKRAPDVTIDAKFSIPFTVGVALVKGRLALDDFDARALGDERIRSAAAKVSARAAPAHGRVVGSGGAMIITLKNGQTFEGEVHEALGAPGRPLSDEALIAKFVDCRSRAALACDEESSRKLADTVFALEEVGDVGGLFT